MDARFIATPDEREVAAAVGVWPEVAGQRIHPVLITAFGDIFVERNSGEILVLDALELSVSQVATSFREFTLLFEDRQWASERLLCEVLLLASERSVTRRPDQVFAVAPHPVFGGVIRPENLVPMDLAVWHRLCQQLRGVA